MLTIDKIIKDNDWKSSSIMNSVAMKRLFNSGIVTGKDPIAKELANGINSDNVQEVIRGSLLDYSFQKQNLGDTSGNKSELVEHCFDEAAIKTFYGNHWWPVDGINQDLMQATQPDRCVLNTVGNYWAEMFNCIVCSTVCGMVDIKEITIGNGREPLSSTMLNDLSERRGYRCVNKIYLHSTTLSNILTAQQNKTLETFFTPVYGSTTVSNDNNETVFSTITTQIPQYVYLGITPVVVDDMMTPGIISFVDNGAFVFAQKNLSYSLMYNKKAKSSSGIGIKEWGSKMLYILHPAGFNFIGKHSKNYSNELGLEPDELRNGGLYKLQVDPKLSRIMNIWVSTSSSTPYSFCQK